MTHRAYGARNTLSVYPQLCRQERGSTVGYLLAAPLALGTRPNL